MTSAWPVSSGCGPGVEAGRRVDEATGERKRFSSKILAPWCRKSPKTSRCCRAVAGLVEVLSQVRLNVINLVDGNLSALLRGPRERDLLVARAGENG